MEFRSTVPLFVMIKLKSTSLLSSANAGLTLSVDFSKDIEGVLGYLTTTPAQSSAAPMQFCGNKSGVLPLVELSRIRFPKSSVANIAPLEKKFRLRLGAQTPYVNDILTVSQTPGTNDPPVMISPSPVGSVPTINSPVLPSPGM